MKRALISLVAILGFSPIAAEATSVTSGSKVKVLGTLGAEAVGGGAFLIDTNDPDSAADFLTFCIEINALITVGNEYFVNLTSYAQTGGAGGAVNGQDPLDIRTAYLYYNYVMGTLTGYDGSADAMNGLQLAIWRIEEEVTMGQGLAANGAHKYLRAGTPYTVGSQSQWLKADGFFDLALANALPDPNFYGVQVMQLWGTYSGDVFGGNRQDQIVLRDVPDSTSTLAAMFVAVCVLAGYRRMSLP